VTVSKAAQQHTPRSIRRERPSPCNLLRKASVKGQFYVWRISDRSKWGYLLTDVIFIGNTLLLHVYSQVQVFIAQ